MTLPTDAVLAVRLNRRIVAAAVVSNDAVMFRDSRYFRGPAERAEGTVVEFLDRLLADLRPGRVAICALHASDTNTTAGSVMRAVDRRLTQSGLPMTTVTKSDVLASWALTALHGWSELRGLVEHVWPELHNVRESVRPYVSDAAAVSLYVQCRAALDGPGP
jgi:hypothetical protein